MHRKCNADSKYINFIFGISLCGKILSKTWNEQLFEQLLGPRNAQIRGFPFYTVFLALKFNKYIYIFIENFAKCCYFISLWCSIFWPLSVQVLCQTNWLQRWSGSSNRICTSCRQLGSFMALVPESNKWNFEILIILLRFMAHGTGNDLQIPGI